MKYYLMHDLNDPSKFKVERRTSSKGTLCVVPDHLSDKELEITEVNGVYSVDFDSAAQTAKDAAQAAADIETAKREKYAKRAAFATKVKIEITVLNESKGWDVAATTAYLGDSTIQQIDNLISNMSFSSAVSLIQSSDLSAYYTDAEKNSIAQMLIDHMAGE